MLLAGVVMLAGCGEHVNEWQDVRYALTEEDLGVETRALGDIERFRSVCPRPADTLGVTLWRSLSGGGIAESTRATVDPGQQVQSFVLDVGPYYATGANGLSAPRGDGSPEFVADEMSQRVASMMREFDCSLEHRSVEIVGELDYDRVDDGIETGVFGYTTVQSGPWWDEDSGASSSGLLNRPRGVGFDEGLAPEDQRLFAEGRYTVLNGTVIVGVEVQSTHEEYVDVDELLQVMVDRVEAEPLPTHAPDDDLLEE